MNTTLKIALHEIVTYLRRPSYLFMTFLIPMLMFGASLIFGNRSGTPPLDESTLNQIGDADAPDLPKTGQLAVVNQSSVTLHVPDALVGTVKLYPDIPSAEAALRAGEVDAYYVIAADYLASGNVERVGRRFSPLAEDSEIIRYLLTTSLISDQSPTTQALIREPIGEEQLTVQNIGTRAADSAGGSEAEGLAFGLSYGLAMLLYITSFTSASYLLQGLSAERENRVMEILLTTITPLQLLTGKIIGLGILGLGQIALWGLGAYIAARRMPAIPLDSLGITPTLVALILLYFILAYLLYGAMMGGLGALVPSVRESGPATFFVVLPAIVPLFFIGSIVESPHSPLAVVLSLIPFTAPLTMAMRLAQGGVPMWQIVVSIALLLVTIPFLLRLVANLFHAQVLLGTTMPTPRQILRLLRGTTA